MLDEYRLMLWDYLVLEHRLRSGRTIVEQFVDAHAELSRQERERLLGWRDVVQGPMPRRSFLITRLVPVGEEWMLSGADERAAAG